MSTSQPTLPFELHEPILTYLKSDVLALGNCALACSAWRTIVQPWMFTKPLHLEPNPIYLDAVSSFFSHAAYLAPHICTIVMKSPFYGRGLSRLLEVMTSRNLFSIFKGIKCLTIDFSHQPVTSRDLDTLSQFSQLRELKVVRALIPSFPRLIEAFPQVTSLALHSVHFQDYSPAPVVGCAIEKLSVHLRSANIDAHSRYPSLFNVRIRHLALRWDFSSPWILSPARYILEEMQAEMVESLILWGEIPATPFSLDIDDVILGATFTSLD
jgi:hypothetical protein